MLIKRRPQRLFDRLDLTDQFRCHRDQRGRGRAEGCHGQRRRAQLIGTKRGTDLASAGTQVALPTAGAQGRLDLGDSQLSAVVRGRRLGQNGEGVAVREIVEGHQRRWVELSQRAAQRVGLSLPGPDQVLVSAGEDLDGLGEVAVSSDWPVVMLPISAHQVGEHPRIAWIALGSGGDVPFSVARRRHRINREHLISRCEQSLHPWAAVGLDPDDDIRGRRVGR